jgi:hypothetical protein
MNRIHKLLKLSPGKDIGYDEFRCEFECAFNFGLDRVSVSDAEFRALQELFDKVVWYSPYPDERAEIPSYIGESGMAVAVARARCALGIDAGERDKL